MIQFIKTLPYPLRPLAGDQFTYLRQVALQTINPATSAPLPLATNADRILHSPLRRVVETIGAAEKSRAQGRDYLREIPFDLQQLCTAREWVRQGSIIVRQRFKEALIQDGLTIARRIIFAQVRALLRECLRGMSFSPALRILVVSHSFRLKLTEAFIKTHGAIEREPALIHGFLHETEVTYPFGGGFTSSGEEIARAIH